MTSVAEYPLLVQRALQHLPDTLHELLAVALADVRELLEQRKIYLQMNLWCRGGFSHCECCLAGATLVKAVGVDDGPIVARLLHEGRVDVRLRAKLNAIDFVRTGQITAAWCALHDNRLVASVEIQTQTRALDRHMIPYGPGQPNWFEQLDRLQADLAAAKL